MSPESDMAWKLKLLYHSDFVAGRGRTQKQGSETQGVN